MNVMEGSRTIVGRKNSLCLSRVEDGASGWAEQ